MYDSIRLIILRSGREIEFLMVAKGAGGSVMPIIAECRKRKIPVKEMPRQKLDFKLPGVNHQGVAIVVSSGSYSSVEEIIESAKADSKPAFILVLDEIEDPHNFGAIIRTAECCAVHGIIIPKRRNVGLNYIVAKTSCGALEYMRVARVTNLASTIDELKKKNIWVYAADMDGQRWDKTDFSGGCCLVVGSEGNGVGRLIKEKCDVTVSLPMMGKVNSLNASVAAGVLMYEITKQRLKD